MDANSTESSITTRSTELISKSKRKRERRKAKIRERKQREDLMLKDVEAPRNEESSVEDVASLKKSELDIDANAQLLTIGHPETEKESAKCLPENNTVGKRKKKKRRMLKAMNNNADPSSTGQNDILLDPVMSDNKHGEVDTTVQLLPLAQPEIEKDSAEGLLEKDTVGKRRRKKRRTKAMNNNSDPSSMGQNDVLSNPGLSDEKHGEVENVLLNPNVSTHDSASSERKPTKALCAVAEVSLSAPSSEEFQAGSCSGRAKLSQDSELTTHLHSASICQGAPRLRRKLLILDVNGLLADIVHPPPKDCNPDACFYRRAIFKRPYCDDFLKFCFERFDVAVWSSRSNKIIVKVVDYLLGKLQHRLLFCWDMYHSTQTNFKTLDNKFKPLVCKELSKVWDRYDPSLPWKRGDYDESNTLLLDDSPYKALLNPANTAIFPSSYNFKAENDNSLGPGGDLRIYLEEVLKAEHVQKYVEQHPFGQRAIDETSSDWNFYSDVLGSLNGQSDKNSSSALNNLPVTET